MIFVILDTNVLVSSFISENGIPAKILDICVDGRCYLLYSSATMREYYDVLNRDKFNIQKHLVEILLDTIEKYGFKVKPLPTNIELKDKSDKKFYDLFLHCASNTTYFVTGNIKDFPNNDHILSPREMMQLLDSKDIY